MRVAPAPCGEILVYKPERAQSLHRSLLLWDCTCNSCLPVLQPNVSLTTTKDQNSFRASISYPPWWHYPPHACCLTATIWQQPESRYSHNLLQLCSSLHHALLFSKKGISPKTVARTAFPKIKTSITESRRKVKMPLGQETNDVPPVA